VRTTDALGAVTTSSYDPLGRQVSTTNPVSGTDVSADVEVRNVAGLRIPWTPTGATP